jgi:hypothetical protein
MVEPRELARVRKRANQRLFVTRGASVPWTSMAPSVVLNPIAADQRGAVAALR